LEPSSGPEGTLCVITGTDFLEDTSAVVFGTYSCGLEYSVISDTQISCIVPAGTGAVTVKVTTSGGTNSTGATFTYSAYEGGSNAAPTVTSVTPNTSAFYDGRGTDQVAIVGTGFTTARAVFFGVTLATAVQATFSVNSSTSITAWAPPGETGVTEYVFVETNYGTNSNLDTNNDFAYPSSSVPTLTSVVPASGFPGDEIVLTGTNFSEATYVQWGTLYAGFRIDSATSIRATVPGDQSFIGGTVNVYVSNPWGISADTRTFTYGALVAKNLKTTATLNTGALAKTTNDSWIVTASAVTCTLSAAYSGMPANSVDSTWYRLDNGADVKYASAFQVSAAGTEGSHKLEYWSVGKDGFVEPTNVGYVNVVVSTTVTLAATAALGSIEYSWTKINLPGAFYQVYLDTNATPTTLVCTTNGSSFSYKHSYGATAVYCRVRPVAPDGTTFSYSNTVGPTTSLQSAATDIADDAITLAKLAPGIQPPALYTGASLPVSFTDYPAGAILYWTNNSTLYKSTGSAWVKMIATVDIQDDAITTAKIGALQVTAAEIAANTITSGQIFANTLTAGEIAAGAIGASELAADSVFAKNLVVADYENLVQNANSELDTTGKSTAWDSADIEFRGVTVGNYYRGANSRARTATAVGTTNWIALCDPVPCRVGTTVADQFHLKAWCKMGTTEASYGCRVQIVGMNSALADVENSISTYNGTTTYAERSIDYTVTGATVVYVQARLCVNATSGYIGYFDDILFRKKNAGNLIVDGTLSANAISGGTISGADVNVSNKLVIGAGGILELTSGATGTIRTAASGQRIELRGDDYDTIRFYSGSAVETGPGWVFSYGDSTYAWLGIQSPIVGGKSAILTMQSTSGSPAYSTMACDAERVTIGRGYPGDNPYLDGARTLLSGAVTFGPSRQAGIAKSHEFMSPANSYNAASTVDEWLTGSLSAGSYTHSVSSDGVNHPGVLSITTASTQYSGMYFRTGTDTIRITTSTVAGFDYDYCEFVFQVPTTTNARARMGFMGGTATMYTATSTFGAGDYGACFDIAGTTLKGMVVINGTIYNAGTTYAISAATWYTARVKCHNGDHTEFFLDIADGSNVYNPTDIAYCPTANVTGQGFVVWNSATGAGNHLKMDYMNYFLAPRSR
jgi:hypothetical protein